jgi:predicted MFS family arabinose efflux permease
MLFGAILAGASWAVMGAYFDRYGVLLAASVTMNVAMVFASTVMGGMMVEAGQAFGAPGRIAALRQFVTSVAQVLAPMLGGYLAGRHYGLTAGIAAATVLALAGATYFVHHEAPPSVEDPSVGLAPEPPRYRPTTGVLAGLTAFGVFSIALCTREALRNVGISLISLGAVLCTTLAIAVVPTRHPVIRRAQGQLTQIFESRTLWLGVVMLFLIYTVPGFLTALYFQQKDVLRFDDAFIGRMSSLEGLVGLGAALLYASVCSRFTLRTLLLVGAGMSGLTTFGYLFYDHATAPAVHAFSAFFGVAAELALMDLAVRSTPRGCEALGFALMMSIRNFGISMSDVLGTQVMQSYDVAFDTMVVVNGSTSLLVVAFVFLLPTAVVMRRERDVRS